MKSRSGESQEDAGVIRPPCSTGQEELARPRERPAWGAGQGSA